MSVDVSNQIADIESVAEALRLIGSLKEVREGALRLASGATRAAMTFERGFITAAYVSSSGRRGPAALKEILELPDAIFQFMTLDELMLQEDGLKVEIAALIANNFSLEGIPLRAEPIAPNAEAEPGEFKTGVVPALHMTTPMQNLSETTEIPALFCEQAAQAAATVEQFDAPTEQTPAFIPQPAAQTAPGQQFAPPQPGQSVPPPVPAQPVPPPVPAQPVPPPVPPRAVTPDVVLTTDLTPADLFKKVLADEAKAEFESGVANEDKEEIQSSLRPDQKILLDELAKLHDRETFEESDPSMGEEDPVLLNDQKLELLENAELDMKSFEESEIGPEFKSEEALKEEQRLLLAELAKLADKDAFHDTEIPIVADEGPAISEQELEIMKANANLLTPEEQKAEFAMSDPSLKVDESEIDFKPFVEPPPKVEEIPDTEFDPTALDSIPTPSAADYAPLIPDAPDLGKKPDDKAKGLIGRMKDAVWGGKMATYERAERQQGISPEKIIGPIILVGLCISLFTIPNYLNKMLNGNQSEAASNEQMRQMLAEEVDDQIPFADNEKYMFTPAASSGSQGSSSGGLGAPSASDDPTTYGGVLAEARSMAAKGWQKRAIRLYETFLSSNPEAFDVRIELINYLISANEISRAREVGINGLKTSLTPAQRDQLWALVGRIL